MNPHDLERLERDVKAGLIGIVLLLVAALVIIGVGVCITTMAHAQQPGTLGPAGRQYYWQGGPAIRVYDGGTGGHSAADARRALSVPFRDGYDDIAASWNMTGSLVTPWTFATDSSWRWHDDLDTTKTASFQFQSLSSGATRFYNWPDKSGGVAVGNSATCDAACLADFNIFTGNIAVGTDASHYAWIDPQAQTGQNQLYLPVIRDQSILMVAAPNSSSSHDVLSEWSGLRWNGDNAFIDKRWWLKAVGDTTKKWQLDLSNQATATTVTDSVPTSSQMLAGTRSSNNFTSSQNLTQVTNTVPLAIHGSSSGFGANFFEMYDDVSSAVNPIAYFTNGAQFVMPALGFQQTPGTAQIVTIQPKSAVASNRTYSVDNSLSSTDFAMTGGTQTISGAKTFTGASVIRTDGTTTRTVFADQASTTKIMALDLTGQTAGSTRAIKTQDRSGTFVVKPASSDVNLTGQTADKTTTNIVATPGAGLYIAHVYLQTTTAGSGTNTVTLAWTDDVGATTDATLTLALGSTGRAYKSFPIYLASGSPTYAVAMGGGSGTWSIRIRLEAAE